MRKNTRLGLTTVLVHVVAVALLVPSSPARAVVGGEVDGNRHPYVGAVGPPSPLVATGVLISPTVVLTAGHVAVRRLGPGAAEVTFDPVADASATWYSGTAHVHPGFNPGRADNPHDLGVIVLDSPVVGVTPASLPGEGMFDVVGRAWLPGSIGELVGYGVSRVFGGPNGSGPPRYDLNSGGIRRVTQETITSVTPAWINYITRGGGQGCAGDSGAPLLLDGSDLVAAINVAGDPYCRNLGRGLRLDTPSARAFLAQYVNVP